MNFLLDTNTVSEWVKPRPDVGVIRWLAEQDEDRVFLSVITSAELRRGVERLAAGTTRRRLEMWLDGELTDRFGGRVLGVGEAVANHWGRLVAASEAQGKRINVMDGFLAATAMEFELTVVTRNVADFERAGCGVLNPWEV